MSRTYEASHSAISALEHHDTHEIAFAAPACLKTVRLNERDDDYPRVICQLTSPAYAGGHGDHAVSYITPGDMIHCVGVERPGSNMSPGVIKRAHRIDFDRVNAAARGALPALCRRWLPDGRQKGREWIARNPTRADRSPGSFKVNLATGRWADFATRDTGGDPVSLAAFLFNISQIEAARRLSAMLGTNGRLSS